MSLVTGLVSRWAKLPAPPFPTLRVERDLTITTADGAVLLADRCWPVDRPDAPIVLVRTPYGRRRFELFTDVIAAHGYQVVTVSCRGTFGSGGTWEPFFREAEDGRDTLAWLADQPWFVPAVYTFGPSYLGQTQWAVAADPPPWLKGMCIGISCSSFRDLVYTHDRFSLELSTAWTQTLEYQEDGVAAQLRRRIGGQRRTAEASGVLPVSAVDRALVGHQLSYYADWVNHEPPSEDYWSPIDFSGAVASMPPVSMVAGWYDCFVHQQLDDFVALQSARRPARITIGPWKHVAIPGMLALVHDAVEAFDQLRDGRFDERARVRLYVMGSHQWSDFDHWPPVPAEVRTYHLGAGEKLSRTEATGGRSRFTYAPLDPTPSAGGRALDGQHAGPHDQHPRESRSDVLCFTSEPMAAPTTVIGRPRFRVTVWTSAEHADLVVRLCDVTGSRSVNICDGIAVISPQTVDRDADGSFTVELELDPTAHTFVKGHRIRLQVSGGAHPLTVRNLGLGEPLATGRRSTSNKFEVAHVGSVLSLPLVP